MAHTTANKDKILLRIKKIKGQISGIEKALEKDLECFEVLQQISAARGAMNSLMNEVLQGHIKEHLLSADTKEKREFEIANLSAILKSYLK